MEHRTRADAESSRTKKHPDGTPWEYPWDSWRDGPHFSASYLRQMAPANDIDAELIEILLADPKLPHLFPNEDYFRRYVVHISKTVEERDRRLAAASAVWRLYRRFWLRAQKAKPRQYERRF